MSFWCYLLRCADGSYYTGQTDNLEKRIAEHRSGAIPGYTAERLPVELVWQQAFADREEARAAGHRIKPWSRAKKEALIRGHWTELKSASLPPSERMERAPRLRSGWTDEAMVGQTQRAEAEPDRADRLLEDGMANQPHPSMPNEVEAPPPLTPPPLIILVRPQLGENIGKAARAMLNFGLTELRLVAPRDGWPNPSAGPAASGADLVLERATVHATVAEAVADCRHVYATTVRRREVVKPVVTPEQAAAAIHAAAGRTAILFGPERSGLETEDVAVARAIVTVPINPAFGSLNLAQAVILVAYEWSKARGLAQPTVTAQVPPAPQEELDGLVDHLETMLDAAGYFFLPKKAPSTKRMLRTLLTKPGWSADEVRTLRGVLSILDRPRPDRRGSTKAAD